MRIVIIFWQLRFCKFYHPFSRFYVSNERELTLIGHSKHFDLLRNLCKILWIWLLWASSVSILWRARHPLKIKCCCCLSLATGEKVNLVILQVGGRRTAWKEKTWQKPNFNCFSEANKFIKYWLNKKKIRKKNLTYEKFVDSRE